MDSAASLPRTLALCLTRNLLLVALVGCGGVVLEANTSHPQTTTPGVTDCWNGSTGQITRVDGDCPR